MSLLSQELLLPIIQSGLSFFQDSFFEQRRKHFQMALKEITDRHGFSSPDFLSSYRSLRQRDLKEENQAISVTDEHNVRQIILDVKDFKDGDLSVKAEGHNVEVEGRVQGKGGNTISTHSFRRRFSLPSNVDMDSVTSTLSSDGILTISAPKKNRPDVPSKFNIPIENKPTTKASIKTQETSEDASSTLSEEKASSRTQTKAETITHQSNSDNRCATETDNKTVQKDKHSQEISSIVVEPVTPLPVMLRGSFFEDSFFRHAHRDFEAAMESILKKSGAESSTRENFKQYRSLRNNDFSNETQAYTLSEDESSYKIVLDAQDFKNGEVQLRVVGESLVVEGQVEKPTNDFGSNLTFQRRFALPRHTDPSDITAALSSDGVLTILVKKKCNTHKEAEHIIPIQVENNPGAQIDVKSQKSRSTGQQTSVSDIQSDHHIPNQERENQARLQQQQLLQQQERQLHQQAQQIQKQEQMIPIQKDQLRHQKQETEQQRAHSQKLQRDEKEDSHARLQQEILQQEEQCIQERQQHLEQIRQQEENERLEAEQMQNRTGKQNSEGSNSNALEKMKNPETTHNRETLASARQNENQQNSFVQMCSDDTTTRINKPVWTPKIGSLESGFLNIKKFECSDTEDLLDQ